MIRVDARLTRPRFTIDAAFESAAGITGLIGPSGSGKSTIIQMIAGLTHPTSGRIQIGPDVVLDKAARINLPPHRRGTGLVFQDAQLFPHLTVRQNLNYGARFAKHRNDAITFDAVTAVLGIKHLVDRSPSTLSGGERQRVAIGRALLASPKILLMDEPLAALDLNRKLEILPFIERLRDEFAIPILYVSHSAEEIARLATTVIRLENGRVTAIGSPDDVLSGHPSASPANRFDALSTITASVAHHDATFGVTTLNHPGGTVVVTGRIEPKDHPVRIAIRATNVSLATTRPHGISIRTILSGHIKSIEESGPFALVTITLTGGDQIAAYVTRLALHDLALTPSAPVIALIKSVAIDERGISAAASNPPAKKFQDVIK